MFAVYMSFLRISINSLINKYYENSQLDIMKVYNNKKSRQLTYTLTLNCNFFKCIKLGSVKKKKIESTEQLETKT